ncbi:hypothetical protein ADK64_14715 [Streptomyces sp. MMG1121]|nr:hypothetical protein ADK64_14715 [Streptomyces sp. MMG1121]
MSGPYRATAASAWRGKPEYAPAYPGLGVHRRGRGPPALCVGPAELVLRGGPLPRLTPHPSTGPARPRTALEKIQGSGLAREEQEAPAAVGARELTGDRRETSRPGAAGRDPRRPTPTWDG